jgi:hypothetical protein
MLISFTKIRMLILNKTVYSLYPVPVHRDLAIAFKLFCHLLYHIVYITKGYIKFCFS